MRTGLESLSSKNLPVGRSATVSVPATSANLGPGFDSLGIALNWYDSVSVTVISKGFNVDVTGEGEKTVPRDQTHLVIATVLEAMESWNIEVPGLALKAHNTIPHGRGLGSSSAALVSGLLLAWALAYPDIEVDRTWLLREAYRREGHADNVAPAILGGFVISWSDSDGESDAGTRARRSTVHTDLAALALVPSSPVLTKTARSILPLEVPFSDAIMNASRAALLVHAIGFEPNLLGAATADRIHQDTRSSLMPDSFNIMKKLRQAGFGAFISGAGPTVLVLLEKEQSSDLKKILHEENLTENFDIRWLTPGRGAEISRIS